MESSPTFIRGRVAALARLAGLSSIAMGGGGGGRGGGKRGARFLTNAFSSDSNSCFVTNAIIFVAGAIFFDKCHVLALAPPSHPHLTFAPSLLALLLAEAYAMIDTCDAKICSW